MAYSHTLLFSEILDKVHKAKTKVEKVAILITNDSESLRMLLKAVLLVQLLVVSLI